MDRSHADIAGHISDRQARLWNALHPTRQATPAASRVQSSPYRFATLSRDEGSLGDEIAKELAERLEWKLFDKEIVNFIAENKHVHEDLVRQLDERSQSLVQEAILRLLRMPENASFGSEEYHDALVKTLVALAARGGAVLMGRGANLALRGSKQGLHIRITGSLETRLRRVSNRWNMPAEKARLRLTAIDSERRSFIKRHYQQEYDDCKNYDLILNTDNINVQQAVSLILSVLVPDISLSGTRAS